VAQSADNREMIFSKRRLEVDTHDNLDRQSQQNRAVTKQADRRLKNPKGLQIEVSDDTSSAMLIEVAVNASASNQHL